jgi:transcription initiation factor TFIID subunit 11
MHPLRQTSFPTSADAAERRLTATSDAGSVTGSFTGSIGGTSADGVFASAGRGKKRGRKSKAEKEREREDASRMGSVDVDGGSVRAVPSGGAGGPDDGDEDDDDYEGELLGREEGTTDTEAEKKNLAYVVSGRIYEWPERN